MQPKPPIGRGPLPGPSYQPPSAPPVPPRGTGGIPVAGSARSGGSGPVGSGQRLQSSNQYLRTPVVRYSSRMRVGKLHPLRVTLTGSNNEALAMKPETQSGGFDPPIVVQLSVPGALVTPPHVIIPVSGGEAQFVVQPLIAGKLTGARIEFLAQGRRVSELALPMKANRGYLAKALFLLALLLPFIIHYFPSLTYVSQISTPRTDIVRPDGAGLPNRSRLGASTKNSVAPAKNESKSPSKTDSPEKGSQKGESKSSPSTGSKTNGEAGKDSVKEKTKDAEPGKQPVTPEKKSPPAAMGSNNALLTYPLMTMLLAHQEPTKESEEPSANSRSRLSFTSSGRVGAIGAPQGGSESANQTQAKDGTPYTGEDAIWAWVRNLLEREGYGTKLIPTQSYAGLGSLLAVDRKYEITKDSTLDWTTGRLLANVMYYCEPVLRFLYRIFIVLPMTLPFGDLILSAIFLALAGLVWMYTNPNRRKLKGPMMDIRLAQA